MTADTIQESQNLSTSVVLAILAVDIPVLLFTGRKHPWVPLLLIFALAPFQHDMSIGGPLRFSISEINLMLTSILFFVRKRPLLRGPAMVPTLLYLGVGLASSLLNWWPSTLTCMVQMSLYLIVAVIVFTSYVRDEEDFRPALHGLLVIGLVLALSVIVLRTGYVLGLHKNGVGGSLSCVVIVCCELWFAETNRRRRTILSVVLVILVAGLFFSLSRGAWIGAATGIFVILALRRQFGLMFRAAFFLVPLIAVCWQLLPDQDRSYTTGLTQDNWNIRMRYNSLYFARNLFYENPVLGVGVGLRKMYDATNLFWLTLAETGVLGIITFLGIHVSFFMMVWRTQKRLRRTELLYSVVALGGALVISRLIHGMVDHYWGRGPIMIAWTAAGMATYGHFAVRHRVRMALREKARLASLEDSETAEMENARAL